MYIKILTTLLVSVFGVINPQDNCKVTLESLSEPGKKIIVNSSSDTLSKYGISVDVIEKKALRGGVRYSVAVRNDSKDYAVCLVNGPEVGGLKFPDDCRVVISKDGGRMIPVTTWRKQDINVVVSGDGLKGTMYWFAFAGEKKGLYVGCENSDNQNVKARIKYDRGTDEFAVEHEYMFYCNPGESYSTPWVDVHPYRGDWHVAADTYRKWFWSTHELAHQPEWLKNCSGWMLTILKQQNGQVIWPYNTIGKEMADAALARGLNVVGLYGRAVGGHDRLYPDYSADPALGGEEELRKGIEELHARGLRCIFYTNGQLIDALTPWWEEKGRDMSVMNADGSLKLDTYQKFKDGPRVVHTLACQSDKEWVDMMIKFAEDANALGADGLIYDQCGRMRTRVCYNPDHVHKVPCLTYQDDLIANLQTVYDHMQKINPDFVLMTEGFTDMELPSVAFYHRGSMLRIIPQKEMEGMALRNGKGWMAPEVLLYTFPEMVNTSNDPTSLNYRQRLNLNAMFNERTEIEVRFDYDRELVEHDRNADPSCYDNVNEAGSKNGEYHKEMVVNLDPKAAREYSYQIHSWLDRYPELMRGGRFIDTEKFTFTSDNPLAIAKAYESADGKTLGVIVWNISTKDAASFSVKPARRYRLTEVSAPDCSVSEGDPIAPESVQLYVFKKKRFF